MKLFLKRNISSEKSCFTIFDELGYEKYSAVFTGSKSASRINVADNKNKTVLKIRKVPLVGTHTFVFKAGKSHVTFVTVVSQKGIHGYYYGNNWHISGDAASGSFSIIDVDNTVISSQIKHADCMELIIPDKSNELYCLATSICLNLFNTVDKLAIQAV